MGEKNHDANQKVTIDRDISPATFGILCGGVAVLWALCTLIIFLVFDNWTTRGQAGDSFGAVNALFSGLAFAGVIYSMNLQRKELNYQRQELQATREVYEAQLEEMRSSRELQAQPLAIPDITKLEVERPRPYYTPPEDKYSTLSRYMLRVSLRNPTQHPAVSVNVRCMITMSQKKMLFSTDEYLSIVAPGAELVDPARQPDFLFSGDDSAELFDAMRQNDPRLLPVITTLVLFKNIVGAHFCLQQSFRVYATSKHAETLRSWHTGIVGFVARYKQDIVDLKELKRRRKDDDWDALFEKMKSEFSASVPGDDRIHLMVRAVDASFSLQRITAAEFNEGMKTASYSQIITGLYDCPADLDSRN
jgi:hypothetical protein